MERFDSEDFKFHEEPMSDETTSPESSAEFSEAPEKNKIMVIFKVQAKTHPLEMLRLSGNCEELGNWDPDRSIRMHKSNCIISDAKSRHHESFSDQLNVPISFAPERSLSSPCIITLLAGEESAEEILDGVHRQWAVWEVQVQLTLDQEVKYRFFTGIDSLNEAGEDFVIVRLMEYNAKPRFFTPRGDNICVAMQRFGIIADREQPKVCRGWLTQETEIHLWFGPDSLEIFSEEVDKKLLNCKLAFIVRCRHKKRALSFSSVCSSGSETSVSELSSSPAGVLSSTSCDWSETCLVEVANLGGGFNSKNVRFCRQDTSKGITMHGDSLLEFRITTAWWQNMVIWLEMYAFKEETCEMTWLASSSILPQQLRSLHGSASMPLLTSDRTTMGFLSLNYCIIMPTMPALTKHGIKHAYGGYWSNEQIEPVEIGHRGAGNSYSLPDGLTSEIRENTIASLKAAAEVADFIEFDVQLSKDRVPVIYHDLHVKMTVAKKHTSSASVNRLAKSGDYKLNSGSKVSFGQMKQGFDIQVCDMNFNQLHELLLHHVTEKEGVSRFDMTGEQGEHQAFPALGLVLEKIDPDCGFNIEVKYPMAYETGTKEVEHFFERNMYVDTILQTIFAHAHRRRIVFSCFDPDICQMLRAKQCKFPVLLLTSAEIEMWEPYKDVRAKRFQTSFRTAVAYNLKGLSVHSRHVVRNEEWLMRETRRFKLMVFCWGDENQSRQVIEKLKASGVEGVIYDRISEMRKGKIVQRPQSARGVSLKNRTSSVIMDRFKRADSPQNLNGSSEQVLYDMKPGQSDDEEE